MSVAGDIINMLNEGSGGGGNVSGVKGDAEETYRTGNVNITAANVGAYTKAETDTLLSSKADTTDVDNVKIASTATGTSITLTDSADANLQTITIKGRSEVVEGEIVSVGDNGFTITTANSDSTAISTATITTGLPYRSVSNDITDEVDNEKVVTRCNEIDLGSLHWEIFSSANKIFYSDVISDATNGVCISTKYTYSSVSAPASLEDNSYILHTNKRLYIRDTNYTDATTFATSLSGEKLVYQLEAPVETPLTSTQIAALAALQTYNSITHIDATDAPTMTVNYLLNTNNGQAVANVDNKIGEKYTTAEKTKLAGVQDNATANTVINTTVTLAANAWTGASAPYTQTVNVANILATDRAYVDLSVSSTPATGIDEIENWAYISKVESGAGTLTFTCYEDKPDIDLNVNVQVVRGTSSGGAYFNVKSVSYTGTGSTSQSITFPDTPFMILGFTQNPIEDRYTRGLIPFVWDRSNSQLCLGWSDTQVQTNTYQFYSNMRLTISGNTMSWTASDATQALNSNGVEYTIYYI